MNRTLLIALGIVGLLFVGAIGMVGIGYVSVNNTCVAKEATLTATKDNSKSVYDNFWKKVKEVAQVPAEYQKGMKETYATIMDARYKNSTHVMMNWIKEANPNFDSSMYSRVQQVIESGRNDFQDSQKQMIDQVRDYKTYVGQMPTSFFARLAGYPKINFADFEVLTSDRTDDAFKSHKDASIDVFNHADSK